MKKTSLARRNALLTGGEISWGAAILAVALAILLVRLFAPNLFWHAFSPLFRGAELVSSGARSLSAGFLDKAALSAENDRLASEHQALANENQSLREALESISALAHPSPASVIAGVVAHPPESPYDVLVIAAGRSDDVTPGMTAYGPGGVPIGIVSSTLEDFASVTLFSMPGVSTTGWVGEASIPLILTGAGAGALHAVLPRSAGVQVGDAVYLPGPGKQQIGVVARVDDDPSKAGVALRIQPSVNLFALDWIELRDTGASFISALRESSPKLP